MCLNSAFAPRCCYADLLLGARKQATPHSDCHRIGPDPPSNRARQNSASPWLRCYRAITTIFRAVVGTAVSPSTDIPHTHFVAPHTASALKLLNLSS